MKTKMKNKRNHRSARHFTLKLVLIVRKTQKTNKHENIWLENRNNVSGLQINWRKLSTVSYSSSKKSGCPHDLLINRLCLHSQYSQLVNTMFSFEVRRHAGRRTGLVAKNGFAVPTHCFGSIRRSICLSQISKMFPYRRSERRWRVNNSYSLIVGAFHVDICLYTLHSEAKVVRPPLIGWATDQRPINKRFTLSLFFVLMV